MMSKSVLYYGRTMGAKNKKPAATFRYGQRVQNLCCDPWLHSDRFEFPHHNRQRAALVPMMVGMMVVQVVAMMGSIEAHILLAHILTNRSYT